MKNIGKGGNPLTAIRDQVETTELLENTSRSKKEYTDTNEIITQTPNIEEISNQLLLATEVFNTRDVISLELIDLAPLIKRFKIK